MFHTFDHRIHVTRAPIHPTIASTLWVAGLMIGMLLLIAILFLGVFATRAF